MTELGYIFRPGQEAPEAPKLSTQFRKRYVVESDTHSFVGRVYDLSIVEMHFDSYQELAKYPDCKYASDVNFWLSTMVRRVESLNSVGDMLWLDKRFLTDVQMPVSKFQWLNNAADVFLMRLISVVDCALILSNEVCETGLSTRKCTFANIKKSRISNNITEVLEEVSNDQHILRQERNERFHHGLEREFSSDDNAFRLAARYEFVGLKLTGTDYYGRKINLPRYFKEGLVQLQSDFNSMNRHLSKGLLKLYDLLEIEFDERFSRKFNDPQTGYGAKTRSC